MSVNSVRSLLENANASSPKKIALKYGTCELTYNQLYKKVNQVAHYLSEQGFDKGSRIGIYSNKSIDQIIAILAIVSTEYVFVPITRVLKPEQIEHIIKDCNISCIITDNSKVKNINEINYNGKIISYESIGKDSISFEEIYKYYNESYNCRINGHDNAAITYSFGSHSFPKGIVITHRNLIDGARIACDYLNLQKDDVFSGVLSFNLDYGLNQIFCTINKCATLAIHKFVLPAEFFTHLIDDKVTVLPIMPINLTQIFDEEQHRLPNPKQLENIRTITSSGGNITSHMIQNCDKYFPNADFYSMHGLTEAFRSAYLEPKQIKIRPSSIGKAIPDVELFVINENGDECKVREVGELIHRGACIYKGFWNAPKESAKRFKSIKILEKVINLEGELTDEIVVASGDYVYKDEEGYIYFISRKDDMIKTRGYRVSPYEIESVIRENLHDIKECAIFSVENEKIEEEIAMVYTAENEIVKNIIIFELKKHLPNYMIPTIIMYKKNLPLHYGKINKDELKKEIFI